MTTTAKIDRPTIERARAQRAARRLAAVAEVLLILVTTVCALGVVLGVVVALVADTSAQRWVGVGIAAGAPLAWACSALPCLAAAAVARYITTRTAP